MTEEERLIKPSSKYHYRFCDTREVLLIDDYVYGVEIDSEFDSSGIRVGSWGIMSKTDWDNYERDAIANNLFTLVDTTLVLNPEDKQIPLEQSECIPHWVETQWDWVYRVSMINGHETIATIQKRKDGRFDAFLHKSEYHESKWKGKNSQKTLPNLELAKEYIEDFWG